MTDTDQIIASRLRRLIETDAFIGDSKDLVAEYSARVRTVNDRLTAAATWLKQGLLSEAVGHSEEWMDAVDAARDLDLGNEKFATLCQRCRECTLEAPVGVERQSAWEISTAYVMYSEARRDLDRYRSACMSGHPLEDRVLALRDACVAVARTREQLGPTGDTVLRVLAGQAGPLVEARLKELGRDAAPIARKFSAAGVRPDEQMAAREGTQEERLLAKFRVIDDAVKDINQCHGEVKLDLSDFGVRFFMELKDLVELKTLLADLERGVQQKNIAAIRTGLKSLDRIADRRLIPIPAAKGELLRAAKALLEEDDRRTNQQPEVAERLKALIDDPKSSKADREKAYTELLDILQGPLPEALNKAYNDRKAVDERLRKARLRRLAMVGAAGGLAAVGAVAFGASLLIGHINEVGRANHLADHLTTLVTEQHDVHQALLDLNDEKNKGLAKLGRMPAARTLVEGAKKQLDDFEKACDALKDKGLEPDDVKLIEQAERLAHELNGAAPDPDGLIKSARSRWSAARGAEATKLKIAGELKKRADAADGRAVQGPLDKLRAEYESCLGDWDKQIGSDDSLAAEVGKDVRSQLEGRRKELESNSEEVRRRLAALNVLSGESPTLEEVVGKYSDYLALKSDRQPALRAALEEVCRGSEALSAASAVVAAAEVLADAPRPTDPEQAKLLAEALAPRSAGIFSNVSPADLESLRSYYDATRAYLSDPKSLKIGQVASEFTNARWRGLKTIVDDGGRRLYTLNGDLRSSGEKRYNLSEVLKNNKSLQGGQLLGDPNVSSAKTPKLLDVGLGAVADGIVRLMTDARAGKAEPLTANMIAAERLRTVTMPTPLKAKLLESLLTSQISSAWPESPECATIVQRITGAKAQLGDDAAWTPEDKAVRAEQSSFEEWLKSGAPQNLDQIAKNQLERITDAAAKVGAFRLVGVARKSETSGIVWARKAVKPRFHGLLFVVEGAAERPTLRKVGKAGELGNAVWDGGQAPPDGAPIIGQLLKD